MSQHIVVDVGNTRMKWGRCLNGRVTAMLSMPFHAAAWTLPLEHWAKPTERWTVTGSHPKHIDEFLGWLDDQDQAATRISAYEELNLELKVDHPEQVGLDRLLNAVAVAGRRQANVPAIVIDAGSAVTVDYLDASGAFCGGAIFPGLRLMAQALHDHTAKLPLVEVTTAQDPPGANTIAAIETGVFHAVLGGMEKLIQAYEKRSSAPPQIFLGGGDADLLAPALSGAVTLWPEMTLQGICRTVEGSP